MKKKLAAGLGVLYCFAALFAPAEGAAVEPGTTEELTLERAIDEGIGTSPALKAYESAAEEARWGILTGLSLLIPHVDLKAKYDFADQYEAINQSLGAATAVVPLVSPQTSFAAEARWVVFDGLANINRYEAALDRDQAARQTYSRKNFETRKRIESTFFAAIAAQRFEEVAEENLKTVQENRAQVASRLEAGVATHYDILRVEVQLSDAETEVERTQDNVVIQRLKLAQAMGMAGDTRRLSGSLPSPDLVSRVEAVHAADPAQRQDFEAAKLRESAAAHEASASTGGLVPSIGLAAHVESYNSTGYPGQAYNPGFQNAWSAGAFMSWSILDGGASIARVGAEHARAARAEHEYEETLLTLPSGFELWKRRYSYSANRYGAKKDDVRRSEEAFRISQISFQQGRKTITDVLAAETDLFRARADVVQSQLDAEEARIELELTLGKEL